MRREAGGERWGKNNVGSLLIFQLDTSSICDFVPYRWWLGVFIYAFAQTTPATATLSLLNPLPFFSSFWLTFSTSDPTPAPSPLLPSLLPISQRIFPRTSVCVHATDRLSTFPPLACTVWDTEETMTVTIWKSPLTIKTEFGFPIYANTNFLFYSYEL